MKILRCDHINDVAVLKLEKNKPFRWSKLLIDGEEYEPCIIMDSAFDVIGVRSPKDFSGKNLEFVDREGNVR